MIPFRDLELERAEFSAETERAAMRVLRSGTFLRGDETVALEHELKAALDAEDVACVAAGADAIALSLASLGVEQGDEVLLPAFTAPACGAAIRAIGARPRLVDVEPESGLLDSALLAGSCTDRTRAMVIVHLFGRRCDLRPSVSFARENGIFVIEDCAQAFGASFDFQEGMRGDLATFSFYPTKNLPADGDAGAVACFDPERTPLVAGIRMRRHSESCARIDELQAAIVRERLPLVRGWIERRRTLALRYDIAFRGTPLAMHKFMPPDAPHTYVVRSADRDALRAHLAQAGIGTLIHYDRLADVPHEGAQLRAAVDLCSGVLSLPLHPCLTDTQQEAVISSVRAFP